jgi:DHA1 family multidrug resistance protein-like MFS transporter
LDPWRRNFHAVWPSLFATSMGLMAFLPSLALYVHERFAIDDPRELAFWAGIIYGIAPFSAAITGPVWGALGDRIGKKPMAIRANVAIALTTALMPLCPSPSWLLVMRAVQGVLAGYVAPAMALVSQAAPRELHGIVIARLQVAMAVGSFLGPLLGAGITWCCGRSALFFVTSLLSGLAALRLHRCAEEAPRTTLVQRPTFRAELGASLGQLLSNRVFAGLLCLVLVLRLGQNMLEPFIALFVRELGPQPLLAWLGASREFAVELTIGGAFAVMAVAQWFFTPWWGRLADRFGPLRCLALLALGLSALLAATSTVVTIDQFLVLRAAAACMMAGSMTLAYAAASKRVADERRTLSFALVQSCMQLGFGLGPQIGGLVAASGADGGVDFRRTFLVAAALCLLSAIGMFVLRRAGARGEVVTVAAPDAGDGASTSPPLPRR